VLFQVLLQRFNFSKVIFNIFNIVLDVVIVIVLFKQLDDDILKILEHSFRLMVERHPHEKLPVVSILLL
jgi:hypothetical protein